MVVKDMEVGVLVEKNREVGDLFLDSVHIELYKNRFEM